MGQSAKLGRDEASLPAARVSAKNIYLAINTAANASVCRIVQNGKGSVMDVSGGIVLAKAIGLRGAPCLVGGAPSKLHFMV